MSFDEVEWTRKKMSRDEERDMSVTQIMYNLIHCCKDLGLYSSETTSNWRDLRIKVTLLDFSLVL